MALFLSQRLQKRTWFHSLCESILKAGPIPQHVALIMDGNRRFAAQKHLKCKDGHAKGFEKMAETLDWCLQLGIHEVTVYAFSIENFNRSKDEVANLMDLAREKFADLIQNRDSLVKHDVCVRVIGNISLLPEDIQTYIADIVMFSKDHKRAVLNVCFSYTAQDDIANAMKELVMAVRSGEIHESDISEELLEKTFYTSHCKPVDLLIRTSGEIRLSDFLLWECSYSCYQFVNVLWPEFSRWNLYIAILYYQRSASKIQTARHNRDIRRRERQKESDYREVVKELKENKVLVDSVKLQEMIFGYMGHREQRTEAFLTDLHSRRLKFVQRICSITLS